MKDTLINIADSLAAGCGKQAAVKEVLTIAKLVGTPTKTPRTFNIRLVDKDVHTDHTTPLNSVLGSLRKEYLIHLCRMGHVKLSLAKDGKIVNIETI